MVSVKPYVWVGGRTLEGVPEVGVAGVQEGRLPGGRYDREGCQERPPTKERGGL